MARSQADGKRSRLITSHRWKRITAVFMWSLGLLGTMAEAAAPYHEHIVK